MMKVLNRDLYIDKIKPFFRQNLIKVLTGMRRSGKTYILYQLINEIKAEDKKANIIFINKEDYAFKDIETSEQLYLFVTSNIKTNKNNYIFIDEVQEIEHFEIALRQLLVKGYDIYCSGSNAHMLSSDLATHLTGRYIEFPIYTLSFKEFLQFHNLEKSMDSLLMYIRYLKNIYNTVILKDVVSRYSIRDINFLNKLIEYLSDSMGSYISSKKITDFLKSQNVSISNNTVLNYISYLEAAFFIDKVARYDIQGKKLFEINDKYYFRDLGIIHSMIPYKSGNVAKVLENLVYNQLLVEGYLVNIGKLGDKEIDFVARKNDETMYIQVAYQLSKEKVFEREFENLLQIPDNYTKIVVTADSLAAGNYKGVEHVNILDFLMS